MVHSWRYLYIGRRSGVNLRWTFDIQDEESISRKSAGLCSNVIISHCVGNDNKGWVGMFSNLPLLAVRSTRLIYLRIKATIHTACVGFPILTRFSSNSK